jgi:hypothetical protein
MGQVEFKKRVYESAFRKRAEEMSFVNAQPDAFPGLSKQDFRGSGEVLIRQPRSGKSHLS